MSTLTSEHSSPASKAQVDIARTCDEVKRFLLEKNKRYGNSALCPARVFSKSSPSEQILVRMDDKLSRIRNAPEPRKNDFVDLVGYLVLFMVQQEWTDLSELID